MRNHDVVMEIDQEQLDKDWRHQVKIASIHVVYHAQFTERFVRL